MPTPGARNDLRNPRCILRLPRQWRGFVCPLAALLFLFCLPSVARAGWGEDALTKEANYISDCSFTEQAWNHGDVTPTAAAYGAINDVRIAWSGPDWVKPGESAVGAIGMMGAARQLKIANRDTKRYDVVLNQFFRTPGRWHGVRAGMRTRTMPITAAWRGAFIYDRAGRRQRDEACNALGRRA